MAKQKLELVIKYYNKGEDTISIKSIPNYDFNWSLAEVIKDEYGNEKVHLTVLTRIANAVRMGARVNFEFVEVAQDVTFEDIARGIVE